jgi:hypothetical protein
MKKQIITLVFCMTVLPVANLVSPALAGEWHETAKVYGDVRFRHESFQTENPSATLYTFRDRQRVRARVGLQATLDDYWMADVRLATDEVGNSSGTGTGDPISSNQTLGDMETRKPIWLDLACIQYKVLFNNGKLTAGKMNNPFECVGKSQLIWDGDLTPEGIAGNFNLDILPDVTLFLNGAGFWVKESSASYDPMIYGAQVGSKAKFFDAKLTAGFGYFEYIDITNQTPYDWKGGASGMGNTLINGKYINNAMLGEGFIDYSFALFDFPIKIYCDYVLNNGAVSHNRAYLTGFIFNKAAKEGSWEIGYNFRQLQKDSVVGAFNDSDFIGGGTNGDGHQISATCVPVDGVKTTLTFFRNRTKIDQDVTPFYNRFQADVVLSF